MPAVARRQVRLPLSKAVEISWKSIRLRLSRSLLVTSSIVLALAFLCSILTTETLLDGLRQWTRDWPKSAEADELHRRRERADIDFAAAVGVLRFEADAAKPDAKAKRFDAKTAIGEPWDDVRARVGTLPLPAGDLDKLLTAKPDLLAKVNQAVGFAQVRRDLRAVLNRPEDLKAAMQSRGVPTEASDIAAARVQTRWVVGLALMVAFVGILNAMVMSVKERFREIGTMKCLGALDGFIVKLFLIESLLQGAAGTTLGVVVGLSVSFGMAAVGYGRAAFFAVPWEQVAQNAGLTMAVGIALSVGGAILPALQAARMEPIAAMRDEA